MKSRLITSLTAAYMILLCASCSENKDSAQAASGSTASGEQAFLAAYRKALESSDTKTLDSFLVTDGTPADVVEFFKLMRDIPAGTTLVDVKLEAPTAEEVEKFSSAMPMPDGKSYKLPIVPTKKLVVTMKEDSPQAQSTSTSTLPVAEKDGKFIIPLPVPAA
jgi:hypothetical protein